MISLNYCQFWSTLDQKPEIFFTTPVEVSLGRLRQKLIYNILRSDFYRPQEKCYFITLTVDEQHYDQVFRKNAGSAVIREFNTLNRNWFKRGSKERPKWTYEPCWRLERGKKNTQRLHFHMLFKTDAPLAIIIERFMDTWDYCSWYSGLDIVKSFQELNNDNLTLFYCAKYSSKCVKKYDKEGKLIEESESPAKTRQEMNSRIWSTSREWKVLKKAFFMLYDPTLKIWTKTVKRNWRRFDPMNKQKWYQMYHFKDETIEEFDKRFYPLHPKLIDNYVIDNSIWYENYAPYSKVGIWSKHNIETKEQTNDWIAFIELNDLSSMALCEHEEFIPSLKEKHNYIAQYFSYDKPQKHRYRKIAKQYLENRITVLSEQLKLKL